MGRGGGCNFGEWEQLKAKLAKMDDELNLFIESCAKELAARLLAKAIKRTPVGQYPRVAGKKGGTLRRGWTGQKAGSGKAYAQSLTVHHYGGTYVIEVINPTEYASYVEFGHRTRGGKGWVKGKFYLTLSESEIQRDAPKIIEKKIQKKLGECFQ